MYKLICMSFDGEYVTEHNIFSDNRAFETIADAWERSSDMGSRWFFYPFHFVTTASGLTIADAPSGLEIFNGRRVKTVAALFAEIQKDPATVGMDAWEFGDIVKDIAEQRFAKSLHQVMREGQQRAGLI